MSDLLICRDCGDHHPTVANALACDAREEMWRQELERRSDPDALACDDRVHGSTEPEAPTFDLGWLSQWDDPNMGLRRFSAYRGRPGDLKHCRDGRLLGSRYEAGRPYFMVSEERGSFVDRVVRRLPRWLGGRRLRALRRQHGWHAVVLDVDLPAKLIPSSTEGHHHLFIDCPMPWHKYRRLLKALAKAGVIEPGYYRAARRFKMTMVRKPGVSKGGESAPDDGLRGIVPRAIFTEM